MPGAHILIMLGVFGCGFIGMRGAVPGAENLTVLSLGSLIWFLRRDRSAKGGSVLIELITTILRARASR
jgi:hypothetical protein